MLDQQLRAQWHSRERPVPMHPTMTFAPDGLMLGAGTVLLRAEGPRRLQSLQGQEVQLLALLSSFYGKATASSVLRNIERAAKAWREGDDTLAYVYLAHAGLSPPLDSQSSAHRLKLAQHALKHGASPRAVFEALRVDTNYIEAVEKAYNPAEPRVRAGSGKTSGEWMSDDTEAGGPDAAADASVAGGAQASSLLSRMPLPAASSFLGELGAPQVAGLGAYASRLLGPAGAAAAAFGLLFIPSPNDIRVEGEVPEIPGLRYSWNRDETALHLTYDDSEGNQRTFTAQLDEVVFRDTRGRVVGRVLSDGNVAIDTAAVSPDLVDEDEPKLCPDPTKDRRTNDLGLAYENYIKSIVNPGESDAALHGLCAVECCQIRLFRRLRTFDRHNGRD